MNTFFLIVLGQIISLFGNAALRFALPLYLLRQTGSAALYGSITALAMLPALAGMLTGGALADRCRKARLMALLDLVTAGISAAAAVGLPHLPLLPLILTVLGSLYAIQGLYQPVVRACLPLLLNGTQLLRGNAVIQLVDTVDELLGPLLGAVLLEHLGIRGLLVLCGSVNPITLRQMDTAEKAGFTRLRLTPRQKLEPGYWASADGKAALAEIEQMLAANPHCIIETNDAGGNQLTADYAAARGIDLDGLRVGISGSVGQMFGALFGSEHLGTLLLTGGDTLLQCMNSVGARELEPVCELESGIVLARFTYQGRTRYVITKSGGFGQEDLLVELADRIAKH